MDSNGSGRAPSGQSIDFRFTPSERELIRTLEKSPRRHELLRDIITALELQGQTYPDLEYHIPGLICEGLTLFVAGPKIGKSWAFCHMALAVAYGGAAFSAIPVQPRPVLYFALEDGPRRLQNRLERLNEDERALPAGLDIKTRCEPNNIITAIAQWLGERGNEKGLVLLDTIGKALPNAAPGESPYSRDYRFGAELKAVADHFPGSAIVGAHHSRKQGADDFIDSVSGTAGLAGSADTTLLIHRRRHQTEAKWEVTGRDIAEGEYAFLFCKGAFWELDGQDLREATANLRDRDTKNELADKVKDVLDFVDAMAPIAVTPAEVEEKFGPTGARYLYRLEKTGRIAKKGRGRYVSLQSPLSSLSVVSGSPNGQTDKTDYDDTPPYDDEVF